MENLYGGRNEPKTPTIKYLDGKVLPVGIGRGLFEAPIPLSPVFDPYISSGSSNSPSSLSPFFRRSGSGVPFDLSDGGGGRGVGFRSPLASIENLLPQPSRSPIASLLKTPVKVEEDVIVMDGILVKQKGSSTRSRGTSSDSGDKNSFYKRDKCLFWEESGSCRLGSKCQFAHGQEELRPARHASKICKSFNLGSCSYGTKCRFVHQQEPMEANSAVLSPAAGAKVGFPVTHTESQQPAASGGSNITPTSASGGNYSTSTRASSSTAGQTSGGNYSTPTRASSSTAGQTSGGNYSTPIRVSSHTAAQASGGNNRTSTRASSSTAGQASGGNNSTSTRASSSTAAQASGGNNSTSTRASSSGTHTKSQQPASGGNEFTSTSASSSAAQASVNTGWSPLDDGVQITFPEKTPIGEDVDAYIQRVLYVPSCRKRLPAFVEICPE
ncbi:hypothetical protein DM860_003114 [Cuscuta australis]|uniref:C3H1-type domain-containing protein n=1 Tax=Cuscuta australis TaxID=267555 RepID=A0A328D580_9ASTE|nr:hypothetical protein DM860_003114 [Cuscuta australis]